MSKNFKPTAAQLEASKKRLQDLKSQAFGFIDNLASMTDQASKSEEFKAFLLTLTRFHDYSIMNRWLISFQCPHASYVAGFHAWKKFNRQVKKGEHGIGILAPCAFAHEEENPVTGKIERSQAVAFKLAYVYDVSQTDGDPLPEPPEWVSPERQVVLEDYLVTMVLSLGLTFERSNAEMPGEAQGFYSSRDKKIVLREDAGTKTLVHEIAHHLLKEAKAENSELVAEAIAWCVAQKYGLPSTGSPNYIALSGGTGADIKVRMQLISDAAIKIISFIEEEQEDDIY